MPCKAGRIEHNSKGLSKKVRQPLLPDYAYLCKSYKCRQRLRACLKSSEEEYNKGKRGHLQRSVEFSLTIFDVSARYIFCDVDLNFADILSQRRGRKVPSLRKCKKSNFPNGALIYMVWRPCMRALRGGGPDFRKSGPFASLALRTRASPLRR